MSVTEPNVGEVELGHDAGSGRSVLTCRCSKIHNNNRWQRIATHSTDQSCLSKSKKSARQQKGTYKVSEIEK